MELCLITPPAHLECRNLLPGRFCLANVAARNKTYLNSYAQDASAGYEVVLDNGAFEGELIESKEYLEVINVVRPRVIVAPDILNGAAMENFDVAHRFSCEFVSPAVSYKPEFMFVPQCKPDETGSYADSIRAAIKSKRFQWIGICRNACYNAFGHRTKTTDESINKFFFGPWAERLTFLSLARENGVRFHMLGIGNNFDMLKYCWWADRADTASLFYQTTLGNIISKDGILAGEVSRPKDYFRRSFSFSKLTLTDNCEIALEYASAAARLRHAILRDRI